ncbi:MAG: sulfatase [Zavarzinella sp.]
MRYLSIVLAFLAITVSSLTGQEKQQPNIVLINIDDLGYADIGPFGSKKNRTPALDTMAKEGCKLTSFYAAPVCSPSRASLITGCYPKRVLPIPHVLFPGNAVGLSSKEISVAKLLKSRGYKTAIVGKWHLGDQPEFMPQQHGFDQYFGLPYSNDMGPAEDGIKSDLGKPLPKPKGAGQPPLPLLKDGKVVKRVLPDDQQSLVELYTTEAVKFITDNKAQPFFLYLPHSAVHFPIYPGKKWAGRSPHGIYADWVEEVDWSVGTVLDAIKQAGISENTLVIFTSDNGGTPRAENTPLRGNKGSTWEGGMRVPTIAWWPKTIPAGTSTNAITGMIDLLPTFVALSGGTVPEKIQIDGVDLSGLLKDPKQGKMARTVQYYYRGLELQAIRQGDWKLHLPQTVQKKKNTPGKDAQSPMRLYNLASDISEQNDIIADHPEIVEKMEALIKVIDKDLGVKGIGPGVRELGKVENPRPIIDLNGKIRPEFDPAKQPRN